MIEDLIIAFIVVFGLFGLLHCIVGFIFLMDRKSRLDKLHDKVEARLSELASESRLDGKDKEG